MDFVLDEDVYGYILDNHTQEQADELLRGFELLFGFGLQYPDSDFLQIISRSQIDDPDSLRDLITETMKDKLHGIIREHMVSIRKDATIVQLNEIATALLLVQHLNDYSATLAILESNDSDIEKFADIVDNTTSLSSINTLEILDSIDPGFIPNLTKYVTERDKAINQYRSLPISGQMLIRLKQFHKFIGEAPCLGMELVQSGVPVGLSVDEYLIYLYIDANIVPNYPQIALNILSILMISSDGSSVPLVAYRKISHNLFTNLDSITRVESIILKIITDFETELMAHRQGASYA